MTNDQAFWDRLAPKYRTQPISNEAAYEQTLDRLVSYLAPEHRVLELGCGTGGTALRLAPHVHSIVATDFAQGMIDQARARDAAPNVSFLRGDVYHPDLEPGVFDVVIGFNLFHLVRDRAAQLRRVADLLPRGGLFISKTPCIGAPRLGFKFGLIRALLPLMQLVGKAPFVSRLTVAQLERDIVAAGFEIVETGLYPDLPPNRFVVARRR